MIRIETEDGDPVIINLGDGFITIESDDITIAVDMQTARKLATVLLGMTTPEDNRRSK